MDRLKQYTRGELEYDNSDGPLWLNLTNLAAVAGGTNADIVASTQGHVYLPGSTESFAYDLDGNLTADAQWNYTWDAENRLISMAARTAVGPQISLKFDYDSQGRRIRKQVWSNPTWTGTPTNDLRFAYDGWNLLATLDPQLSPLNTSLWGLDLSGSPQGAGGVGGLLVFSEISNSGITNCFPAFDGNGNVMGLIGASDGSLAAQYEYGPFGEVIRATGPAAKANPLRFSTKYLDDETDLHYYGYRYHSASTGGWLSEDPSGERGGLNLYGGVGNDPVNVCDPYGLWGTDQHHALIDKWLQLYPAPRNNDWSEYWWRGCIVVDVPARLKEGNDIVDGVGRGLGALCDAQSSANSYQHSMRAWYESVATAKSKRDVFVKDFITLAQSEAAGARGLYDGGDKPAAERMINAAIVQLGKAQHPIADETSPAHAGFQRWFGIVDGISIMGPVGYLAFMENHHRRESAAVYAEQGDTPAIMVAGQMHSTLEDVLR